MPRNAFPSCRNIWLVVSCSKIAAIDQLFAFQFVSNLQDDSSNIRHSGRTVYDATAEYERMGVGTSNSNWRLTKINACFEYSPTYPSVIAVPSRISDTTLKHIGKFRSKSRIPALSYIHSNGITLTRSSQPMVGIKPTRSIQDEKLVEAIFTSADSLAYNLIIDARPLANALTQVAINGGGTESADHYHNCKIVYLGIENIHVMRESVNKLYECILYFIIASVTEFSRVGVERSGWLKHLKCLIDGAYTIVNSISFSKGHVLVHCRFFWGNQVMDGIALRNYLPWLRFV